MVMNPGSRRRSVFTWGNLARAGVTAAFFLLFYLIWNSTANLDKQLQANADQFAAARNLQVEYKNEIQEWKNVLLRSNSSASLEKNWSVFEGQYQKVADATKAVKLQSDVRAINVKMDAFIEAHKENYAQYRKGTEILARHGFDFHPADDSVKGIDRPLLNMLDAVDSAIQEEKSNIVERVIAKARNQIEQSLIALAFMVLILIWKPKS